MRWLLLFLLLPWAAQAQNLLPDRTTLVADSVTVQSPTVLVARGHVEVFFKTQHLTASAITYDKTANRLTITGPIRVESGTTAVFLADQADLSADLTEGLLTSARIVLDQKLQLAAGEVLRSDGGRYTAMRQVVASSCTICEGSTTPLWEIRSREVVHDAVAQQIWFSDATLRFVGVPVLFIPELRVPDPSLTRATGFLIPKLRSTTSLGTGFKLPYLIVMGPSRDVLLTPYFTNTGNRTLALRFRQAFAPGTLQVDGSLSRDSIKPGLTRGYVQAQGSFALGHGYGLYINGIMVSDPSYLSDYGISTADQLNSTVGVSKTQRDLYFSAAITGTQSLRAGDSSQPTVMTDMDYHRRYLPETLGGEANLEIQTHSLYCPSNVTPNTNCDSIDDGRDMERLTFKGDWQRTWTLSNGMQINAEGEAEADFYTIAQDAVYQGTPSRTTGAAGVELRWPWVKAGRNGGTQMIEPVVQLVTAPQPGTTIPNEDSTLVEFDESNLFGLDRYPGADAFEGGTRLNVGVNYLRTAPTGWTAGLTAGRVFRTVNPNAFSALSGLQGTRSDWLLSSSLSGTQGLSLTTRALVDDTLALTKGEMRFDLTRPKLALSGGYEFLRADTTEARILPVRELVLDSSYDLTRNWKANLTERYDLVAHTTAQAGLNLNFQNECLSVDVSVSRSYASSTSVTASTDFGLSLELLGFGGSAAQGKGRVCRR